MHVTAPATRIRGNRHEFRRSFRCGVRGYSRRQLVGGIYDSAPIAERRRILEHLLRPLGALAIVGVCNGIFTKIWFRNGWSDLHIRAEDAQSVQGIDVIALVDYVQQASVDTIGGLASMLAASP